MSVAKAVVRGVLIAGWLGSSALGDPILFLGTFSDPSSPSDSAPDDGRASSAPAWSPAPPVNPAPQGFVPLPAPAASTPPPSYIPPQPPPIAPPAPTVYDASINFGPGPYPDAESLTSGNALPWFASQPVAALFGGAPDARSQADFENAVIQRVAQTFRLSGVPLSLTSDPGAPAAHTLSVVANTVNPTASQVIGMTYLGGNGFHFIDNAANSSRSIDQLEWIVAHNVAHELMLAFNVPEVHDTSGAFIDARDANWRMMIDPNARFSPDAVRDLLSKDFRSRAPSALLMGAQELDSRPVPEPTTLAAWILGVSAVVIARRARARMVSPPEG